jgi:hypothetical protein
MMIELRRVLKRNTALDIVEVLEYRTWVVRIDASGAITPLPLPIEWTDWKEVSFVAT